MSNKEFNTKREMGYHGSNMHGYSLHKKEEKLEKFSVGGTDQRESEKQHRD